jgi:hypothetical protein
MKSFAPSLKDNLPLHAQYLLNLDTKHGGIGLTSPRLHAIPAFILSTKTTIDTIQRGIFLGQHRPRYHLPPAFTSLYNNHQHSSSPLFSIFYKFTPDLASLCTSNNTTENQISAFLSHSPLHQCHDAINTNIKHRLQSDFLQRLDKDSEHNIEEILDGKLGQGLLDLPRSDERNRQPNDLFRFNLHRCLRLNIWESTTPLICPLCHQDFDTKGDHLFQCAHLGRYLNTKLHHKWRDTWAIPDRPHHAPH